MKSSLFAGIISPLHSLRVSKEIAIQALQFSDKPQTIWTYQDDTCLVAQWMRENPIPHDEKDSITFFFKRNRYCIVAWSRLDNRTEIAVKINIHPNELSVLSDADLILETYLRFGSDCVKHLVGDFAFVIYDTIEQALFCARDPLGTKPLFYAQMDQSFIFASNMAFFFKLPFFQAKPDEMYFVKHLLYISPSSFTETCCNNIQKLSPGHFLIYRNQRIQITRYHSFDPYKVLHFKDKSEYVEAYRATLRQAVMCRLSQNRAIGAELSGGLDSTSVVGVALECDARLRQTLHTFSHDKQDLDGACIDEALIYFNLQGPHYRFQNNVMFGENINQVPQSLALLGYPEEIGMASFHIPFYRLAETQDVQILLSGFGGDEIVTQRPTAVVLELLSKCEFKKAWETLPGKFPRRFLRLLKQLGRLIHYQFFQKNFFEKSLLKVQKKRYVHFPIAEYWKKEPLLKKQCLAVAKQKGYIHVNEQCLEKFYSPVTVARLETCSIIAALYNVEYAWPLLDVRLIELFLSFPPECKWYQGISRYLHREAIKGKIPESIRQQPTKDMGCIKPFPPVSASLLANLFFSEKHNALFYTLVDMKKLERLHILHKEQTELMDQEPYVYQNILLRCIRIALWYRLSS